MITHDGGNSWCYIGQGDGYQVSIDKAKNSGRPVVYRNQNAGYAGNIQRVEYAKGDPCQKSSTNIYYGSNGNQYSDPYREGHLLIADGKRLRRFTNAHTMKKHAVPSAIDPTALGGVVSALDFVKPPTSSSNPVYYVGTTAGEIWRLEPDAYPNPLRAQICDAATCGPFMVSGIATDPHERDRLYATLCTRGGGFRCGGADTSPGRAVMCEWNTVVTSWVCDDIDQAFNPGGAPPGQFHDIVADPQMQNTVYVGTERGAYLGWLNGATGAWEWERMAGLPNASYINDMAADPGSGTIRAATWGRGVWELVRMSALGGITTDPVPGGITTDPAGTLTDCTVLETPDAQWNDRAVAVGAHYTYTAGSPWVMLNAVVDPGTGRDAYFG